MQLPPPLPCSQYGFSSTSPDRSVAEHYGTGPAGTIFEMQMGLIDRGAELTWISQYPHEAEVLFPPLTGELKPSYPRCRLPSDALRVGLLRGDALLSDPTRDHHEQLRDSLVRYARGLPIWKSSALGPSCSDALDT